MLVVREPSAIADELDWIAVVLALSALLRECVWLKRCDEFVLADSVL
jgi:hypothetical protein